jgi:hypothetical protein
MSYRQNECYRSTDFAVLGAETPHPCKRFSVGTRFGAVICSEMPMKWFPTNKDKSEI